MMSRINTVRVGLALFILFIIVGLLNAPSIVTIQSDEGANISVTEEKDGELKEVGKTKVTRLLFSIPENLYISAEVDGKRTVTSIQPQRFGRQTVNVKLADAVSAKKISNGSVVSAIFKGTEGRGIVSGQDTLVNFSTNSENEPLDPKLLSLPYIRKIIWYDFNNFVYLADKGVGQFIAGTNEGLSGVGTSISGDVKIEQTNDTGSPLITDISKYPKQPLVLLSNNNIFVSNNMGTTLRAITSFNLSNSDTAVFSAADSIFKTTEPVLSDNENEDKPRGNTRTTVEEFTYNGQKISTIELENDVSDVLSVVKHDDVTYVLTSSQLHTIKDGRTLTKTLYFKQPAGMVVYKNRIVVLGSDGLWQVGNEGNTFQLLYSFGDYGDGLPRSLTVDPNNQLIFGTTPRQGEKSNTATFVTSL